MEPRSIHEPVRSVRVHLTNLTGLGAFHLASALLPALEASPGYRLECLYLPAHGPLADYSPRDPRVHTERRRRVMPNSISRALECTVGGKVFDGPSPLLVLGDLPIRCRTRQTVFLQSPLLTDGGGTEARPESLKYRVARTIFRRNLPLVADIVVQSAAMQAAVEATYPDSRGRIHVVGQPVPPWLLDFRSSRTGPITGDDTGLRLLYPAASYPHKNHGLLAALPVSDAVTWPVKSWQLTIPGKLNPSPGIPWLSCSGLLTPAEMVRAYQASDAVVFLSLAESYGFPLVEAMWLGLPIVCADLPYARALCGSEAIYFDPGSVASLRAAIFELDTRVKAGWWPQWDAQVANLPVNWAAVAESLLRIASA